MLYLDRTYIIDEVRLVDRRWYQSKIIKLTETCY